MGTTLPVTLLEALCLAEPVQLFEVPLKSWSLLLDKMY